MKSFSVSEELFGTGFRTAEDFFNGLYDINKIENSGLYNYLEGNFSLE
jgi:hypothetical protein